MSNSDNNLDKIEEKIKERHKIYEVIDINVFEEMMLQQMPKIHNFFKISMKHNKHNKNQEGGNINYIEKMNKYKIELYNVLVSDTFFNKLFVKTNYTNYKNQIRNNMIKNKFDITSIDKYTHVSIKGENLMHDLINDKLKYNNIEFKYNIQIKKNVDTYKQLIDYIINIINNNLMDNGNMIIQLNVFASDTEYSLKFANVLIKNFKNVYMYVFFDPLIMSSSPFFICINKQISNKILNQQTYDKIFNISYDNLDYTYQFINKFLLYDDLLKESICYKIMAKF